MLRALIIIGVVLMAVGFGTAGLQYWQGQSEAATADRDRLQGAGPSQGWLISTTGALVPRADVRAYLQQDRMVPSRKVVVARTARLADLLGEGEKLPETPYLQVLADIRAPRIAEPLCKVLSDVGGQLCEVNAARVVEGSVNPVLGTAQFRIELVIRPNTAPEELPDLAAHVLNVRSVPVDFAVDPAGSASPEAALGATLQAARAACLAEAGIACRILDLSLDWQSGQTPRANARIAWLSPLPDGMYLAPSLDVTEPVE